MNVPEHLWRFPTRSAIESVAARFGLPFSPSQQDWEWEVADPGRIDEFLEAFRSASLGEDERFVLMEVLLQSFESSEVDLNIDHRWQTLLAELDRNVATHAHSIWYWACVGESGAETQWRVSPALREVLERHKAQLLAPSTAT